MNDRSADTLNPPTRRERLRAAAERLRQPGAVATDFYPQDDLAIEAWIHCRARCAEDRGNALDHLERFLDDHAALLDDLIWRVHFRNGPATFLDDIGRTIERVI
jgi:hypothetical protein